MSRNALLVYKFLLHIFVKSQHNLPYIVYRTQAYYQEGINNQSIESHLKIYL